MRVEVAKVPIDTSKSSALNTCATLCYYYPQYTLSAARKLPYKHVKLLLKIAQQHKAIEMMRLTEIAAAPHTKKMVGVKNLIRLFKGMAK